MEMVYIFGYSQKRCLSVVILVIMDNCQYVNEPFFKFLKPMLTPAFDITKIYIYFYLSNLSHHNSIVKVSFLEICRG